MVKVEFVDKNLKIYEQYCDSALPDVVRVFRDKYIAWYIAQYISRGLDNSKFSIYVSYNRKL